MLLTGDCKFASIIILFFLGALLISYFCMQVLSQDESPLLYSLVFGEGVVNDATSVVLFRAVQKLAFKDFTGMEVLRICGSFLQLFFSSTVLGIAVSLISLIS